jgi:hypothetical protein
VGNSGDGEGKASMGNQNDAMLNPHPITFWIERCPVCSVTLSGWLCLFRAGWRGFFICPNCESALELRGRLNAAILMTIVLLLLGGFTWWFLGYLLHRTIGLVLGFGAAFAFLVFMWVVSVKSFMSVGRKDVDTTFVM